MRVRPALEGDLPQLLGALNAKYAGTYEFSPYTAGSLLDMLKSGAYIAVAEDGGRILGSVCCRSMALGDAIEWLVAGDPDSERRLLAEAESHAKRGRAICFVADGSPEVNDWLRMGYSVEERELQMTLPLRRMPAVSPPEGFMIRHLLDGEDPQLIDLVNSSFGWPRLRQEEVDSWRRSPNFSNEWIHVAECGSRLVSVTVCKEDEDYNRSHAPKRGYIGPGATLPEFRGRSLASLLMTSVINFLHDRRFGEAVLYTSDANAPSLAMLRRTGFTARQTILLMSKRAGQRGRD
jgi:ribosomal protein S18 acetylase RimI-like enzyme